MSELGAIFVTYIIHLLRGIIHRFENNFTWQSFTSNHTSDAKKSKAQARAQPGIALHLVRPVSSPANIFQAPQSARHINAYY